MVMVITVMMMIIKIATLERGGPHVTSNLKTVYNHSAMTKMSFHLWLEMGGQRQEHSAGRVGSTGDILVQSRAQNPMRFVLGSVQTQSWRWVPINISRGSHDEAEGSVRPQL